jgi:hypothetical protein
LEYNVTGNLKAGIVEPEEMAVTRQQIGKHVPTTTMRQANKLVREGLVISQASLSFCSK